MSLQQIPSQFRLDATLSQDYELDLPIFQKVDDEVDATFTQPDFAIHVEIYVMKI